jgi:hypothetical protein
MLKIADGFVNYGDIVFCIVENNVYEGQVFSYWGNQVTVGVKHHFTANRVKDLVFKDKRRAKMVASLMR